MYKHNFNEYFNKASHGKRCQHIIETLNNPEAYGDWDDDPTLDVDGHRKRWKKILVEMLVMTLFQFLSNMVLMVPLIITGTFHAQNH